MPISGLSENGFATVVGIDTLGTYNTIKATLPYVRETRGSVSVYSHLAVAILVLRVLKFDSTSMSALPFTTVALLIKARIVLVHFLQA